MAHRIRFIKALGLFDSIMLGVGFIIGSGIYIMPILAASRAGFYSIFAWIIGGAFSIITGLCFAENAAIVRKAGGLYSYAHTAFGDFVGYITGYTFWLGYWITIAAEMWAIAWYLKFFIAVPDLDRLLIAFIIGCVFTYINYTGVARGKETEDILTIGKILPLMFFVMIGAFFVKPQNLFLAPPLSLSVPQFGTMGLIFSSTILVLWAYQGAEIISVPEEEIKNAKKIVPKAIMISVLFVTSLYLLVAIVSMGVADWRLFIHSESPLPDIAKTFLGGIGGSILAIGGLISILGALNAIILGSARVSYAMARDKLFPKFFDFLHEKYRTPSNALILHFFLAVLLALLIRNFTKLALIVVLFTLIPYMFSCAATIKLQRKHKPTNLRGVLETEIIPIVGIVSCAILFSYLFYRLAVIGTVFLIAGVISYFFIKRSRKVIKAEK